MARRTVRQFVGKQYIIKYNIDDNIFSNKDINIKEFTFPSNEWALFVITNLNRNFTNISDLNSNFDLKHAIVIGPVANDDIRLLFDLFEDKIITINELKRRLEYKELTKQISFHIKKGIQYLNKEGSCSL